VFSWSYDRYSKNRGLGELKLEARARKSWTPQCPSSPSTVAMEKHKEKKMIAGFDIFMISPHFASYRILSTYLQ